MSQRMPKFFISLMQKTMKFESLLKYLHYRSRQRGLIISLQQFRIITLWRTESDAWARKNREKIFRILLDTDPWSVPVETSASFEKKEARKMASRAVARCRITVHCSTYHSWHSKKKSKKFRCDTAFVQFARNIKLSCHQNANLTHQYAGIDDLLKYRQRTSMNKNLKVTTIILRT